MSMNEQEVLDAIAKGESATYLLKMADPKFARKFKRLDQGLVELLDEVKTHFPDAQYYTASGGFSLMLGREHSDEGRKQQQLVALTGRAEISDGDF